MQEMLSAVRRRFFADETPRRWAQEQVLVKQAIAFPARYLDDRGLRLPGGRYREILIGIFRDVREHMRIDPRRPAAYLLKAVQDHMLHQGDRYCQEAKATRTAGQLAPGEVAGLRGAGVSSGDHVVAALAAAHAALAGRVQRRCKPAAETQQELFKGPESGRKRAR